MGEGLRGGIRAALIAAAGMALPCVAYAQESLELESRITVLEQRTLDAQQQAPLYQRVQERDEGDRIYRYSATPDSGAARFLPFLSALTSPLAARTEATCTNAPGTPGQDRIRRIVSAGLASGAASFSSNAQEVEDGESDVVIIGLARLSWTRRSARGLCSGGSADSAPSYDPRWSLFANVSAAGSRYLDNTSTDTSRVAIAIGYNTILGQDTVNEGRSYRSRLNLEVRSAANYREFYDNWSSDTYDARATYSRTFAASPRGSSGMSITAGHVFSNPDRNSYDHASIELQRTIVDQPSGWKLRLSATAAYRDYESAEPVQFDETRYTISAVLSRQIAPDVNIDIGINLDARESDIPIREFEAASAPITIGFSRTF